MSTYTAELIGGREWDSDAGNSITSLKRSYIIRRGSVPAGSAAEEIVASDVSGLPQPGAAHSARHPNLVASSYRWREGTENAKSVLYVDVGYTCRETEVSEANKPPRGQAVEQCGWKSGSISRDLVSDAGTGALVVNSAGQPFGSTVQIDIPAPTFTMVIKTTARQGWAYYFGKINDAEVTVGGLTCAPHTLRCVQLDEERLWNDDFGFKYRYTVGLQFRTNIVIIGDAGVPSEIGWDEAFIDVGTHELKTIDGAQKLVEIKTISAETGNEVAVSEPVLLDGAGGARLEANATPFAIRFQAYPDTTFPDDMYTEPA